MGKKEANKLGDDYTIVAYNKDVSLVYSKTQGDNLPI